MTTTTATTSPAAEEARNEVLLRGRISSAPTPRELPSGSRVVTFRLVVPRTSTPMTRGSRQRSDWVECTAWSAEMRRKVSRWAEDDVVEIGGALRRRHYRSPQGARSAVEIEVLAARRVARAGEEREPG